MIRFPEEAKYEYCEGSKVIKKCKKLLEKSLRKIGNFKKNIPIEIANYHHGEHYYDTIYEVKDLDNTLFKFYNFHVGSENDDSNRFSKNYQFTIKKESSNFYYKYNFSSINDQKLEVIEVSYPLTEDRTIHLDRRGFGPVRIIIKEGSKKYTLGFYDSKEEYDMVLLADFENTVEKAKQIEILNLENILKILNNQNKVSFVHIYKENRIVASIGFKNGNIIEYYIEEENKKIEVKIKDKIIRNTTREYNNTTIKNVSELTEENYEIIQSDYKRLFKQL